MTQHYKLAKKTLHEMDITYAVLADYFKRKHNWEFSVSEIKNRMCNRTRAEHDFNVIIFKLIQEQARIGNLKGTTEIPDGEYFNYFPLYGKGVQ